MIRERDVERLLVKECKARGWLCLKWVSPGLRGVPDRIVLKPYTYGVNEGSVEFVELKAPGEKPTAAQKRIHERLRALGFTVSVLCTFADVEAFVSGA